MKIEMNMGAIIADLKNEFDSAQDRYERHDDKITAIIHMLRYAFAIDVTYKTNGYGYVVEFTLDGINIHEVVEIELQGYITRWIESEKQRINEKYFA